MKSLGDRFYNTLYTHAKRAIVCSSSIHYRRLSLSNLPYHVRQRSSRFKSCFVSSSLVRLVVGKICVPFRRTKTRVVVHTFAQGERHAEDCARAKRAAARIFLFLFFLLPSTLPFIFLGTFYTSVSSLTLLLSLSLILLNSFVSPLRRHNSHSCILNLPSRPFYILLAFFCFNYVYLIHLSPSFLAFCDSFYSFYFIVYEIIREITFVIFYRGYVVSWIY